TPGAVRAVKAGDDGPGHIRGVDGTAVHLDPRVREKRRVLARLDPDDDVGCWSPCRDRDRAAKTGTVTGDRSRGAAGLVNGIDRGEPRANPEQEGVCARRRAGAQENPRDNVNG